MRRARRFGAFLTSVLLLHSLLAGSGALCDHPAIPAAIGATLGHEAGVRRVSAHGAHSTLNVSDSTHGDRCAQLESEGCPNESMPAGTCSQSSCATMSALASEMAVTTIRPVALRPAPLAVGAPASIPASPDLPPPRV